MATLPIADIRLDFQPPQNLDEMTVETYVLAFKEGCQVEPVTVYWNGETFWLFYGFHRVEAARRCGHTEIDAEIIPGTSADMEAKWQSFLDALRADLRR